MSLVHGIAPFIRISHSVQLRLHARNGRKTQIISQEMHELNGSEKLENLAKIVQRNILSTNHIIVASDERMLVLRCVCVTFQINCHLQREKKNESHSSHENKSKHMSFLLDIVHTCASIRCLHTP